MAMAVIDSNSNRSTNGCTRTKLLNRLGYFKSHTTPNPCRSSGSFRTTIYRQLEAEFKPLCRKPSILRDVVPTVAKLNDSEQKIPTTSCTIDMAVSNHRTADTTGINSTKHRYSNKSTPSQTTQSKPNTPGVKFNNEVTVLSIPSRYQYSNRIKRCLWSNRKELSEMAERNVIEFTAEGWDWRSVVMEHDMYLDIMTGDRIHPCHFLNDPAFENSSCDPFDDCESKDNKVFRNFDENNQERREKDNASAFPLLERLPSFRD